MCFCWWKHIFTWLFAFIFVNQFTLSDSLSLGAETTSDRPVPTKAPKRKASSEKPFHPSFPYLGAALALEIRTGLGPKRLQTPEDSHWFFCRPPVLSTDQWDAGTNTKDAFHGLDGLPCT